MPDPIVLFERNVAAKGASPNNEIDMRKLKSYFFPEEWKALALLEKAKHLQMPSRNPILFYPGCGADIVFPLCYLEKFFPKAKEAHFLFVDIDDSIGLIKTILDDVGITFSEEKKGISFYWKNIFVMLECEEGDVFRMFSRLPPFDIYFERKFRIMKGQHPRYELHIFSKLKDGGVLISDSGFESVKMKKIKVPKELSAYGEMIVGVKK